ncbi:hypothetical protein IAD21_03407 [Abditibacteriota bacterium]|nr:hypothetical protein IAD21_03407 [Abditibacteriota bacterium]
MIRRILPYFVLACFLLSTAMLRPLPMRARGNASRATCQSNLKQIGFAFQQYAQDNNDRLPSRYWGESIALYAKKDSVFQCPETPDNKGTSDYFFNAHFLKGNLREIGEIESPATLIFLGEGLVDVPLNTTLAQLPSAWFKDEKSPLWRHLNGANYGFGDGHVKWLKAGRVDRNLKVVTQ